VKFVAVMSLFVKDAPAKLAPERSVLRKFIPDRSLVARDADRAMAVGPRRNPARTPHIPAPPPAAMVGNMVPSVAGLPPVIPPPVEFTPVRVALVKFAPLISAPVKTALVKLAPVRLARAILYPVNVIPDKSAERRRTPGPTINPLRTKYAVDCGGVAGNVAVLALRNSPVVILVRFVVVVNIAPRISAPVNVAPDKSMPLKFASVRDTSGPTRYPAPLAPRTEVDAFGSVILAVAALAPP